MPPAADGAQATGSDAQHGSISAVLLATLEQLKARDANQGAEPSDTARDEPASDANPQEGLQPSSASEPAKATLGALIDALDERAFGLMLLILALPCCIPFLWGIPQIVALPMLALTGQLVAGRAHPWLPEALAKRDFDIDRMKDVVRRAERYVGWFERLSAERLTFLTHGRGLQIIGVLLLIPTASILVPLPSTNTAPGIGVAIASVGLLQRDGLLTLLGLVLGLVWVALLIFLGAEAISLLRDVLTGAGPTAEGG